MHLALAEAFGTAPAAPKAWAEVLASGLDDLDDRDRAREARLRYQRLAELDDAGVSMRIHGDLHLGQLLRNEDGWYVLDFEGEPRVPLAVRRETSSPLRDVAGMLRSFQYASEVALLERREAPDPELSDLALAWEDRNASAFLGGYLNTPGVDALLPVDDTALYTLLGAFELGKAVYEVGYERDHRPEWLPIPQRALARLLG
jgi:maltokinase